MRARLGIVSLVVLGVAACSSPDWVGDAPDIQGAKAGAASADGAEAEGCADEAAPSSKAGIDIDVASLDACCEDKGKAHCVPEEHVPASTRSSLDACNGGGLCIPDSIIEGRAPKACESEYGPGVCVSLCVKAIAEKASLLKQVTCATNEVCAPCISPLDNKPTGACELGKAKPASGAPSAPAKPCGAKEKADPAGAPAPATDSGAPPGPAGGGGLSACCGGQGACVPEAAVPADQKERLEQKECASAQLCAPKENIDKSFVPKPCIGESFTGEYEGVCLSSCIAFDFLEKAISEQGSCDSVHRCIPCRTPLGTDTGAPGCK